MKTLESPFNCNTRRVSQRFLCNSRVNVEKKISSVIKKNKWRVFNYNPNLNKYPTSQIHIHQFWLKSGGWVPVIINMMEEQALRTEFCQVSIHSLSGKHVLKLADPHIHLLAGWRVLNLGLDTTLSIQRAWGRSCRKRDRTGPDYHLMFRSSSEHTDSGSNSDLWPHPGSESWLVTFTCQGMIDDQLQTAAAVINIRSAVLLQ